MVKRLLDANASDFRAMTARDLVQSIRLSQGRVVAAEVVVTMLPLLDKVSNTELCAGMGADLILLRMYDVLAPQVLGFPDADSEGNGVARNLGRGVTLATVKAWIGRPVGINLEPVKEPAARARNGRAATPENARAAVEQGADFVVLYGNPHAGVTSVVLARTISAIRQAVGDRVVVLAGRMPAAGTLGCGLGESDIAAFAQAGADGLLLPAPGAAPGVTVEIGASLVAAAHQHGMLVMSSVGTSQEGASTSTIEQMALMSKMTGADIHHLGDAGLAGMAIPENITAWSMALRGRRHTWHRMAGSLLR